MHSKLLSFFALTASVAVTSAHPSLLRRVVTELNQAATEEAHPRDDTATRAFSSVTITTGNGKCLFVDELSGDFRANLLPIQVKDCDGSAGEKWDVITAGKHNDQPGTMLIVSALTQGCFNFDPRRAAGDQVNIFSCGGRADGGGAVTNSQLFDFATVTAGPLTFEPGNQQGTCLTSGGARLDQAPCNANDPDQQFTFGGAAAGGDTGAAPAPSPTEDPVADPAPEPTATDVAPAPVATEAPVVTAAPDPVTNATATLTAPSGGFATIPAPSNGTVVEDPAAIADPIATDVPDDTEVAAPTATAAPTRGAGAGNGGRRCRSGRRGGRRACRNTGAGARQGARGGRKASGNH
ncbi:hypothetical protein ABW21_db0204496 [Orbilia brochopaga]|nr:hypothetical protein ABW21_db0204496 [Drechslerella brochopaga]